MKRILFPFVLSLLLPIALLISIFQPMEIPFSDTAVYIDSANGGNSIITRYEPSDSVIYYEAILGEQAKYPYVNLILEPHEGVWDFSSYSEIQITLTGNSSDFNCTLLGFEKGFSDSTREVTHRYYQIEQSFHEGVPNVIPLKSLITPAWWYAMNKTKREEFGGQDLSAITGIVFSNHPSAEPGDTIRFELAKVTFVKSKGAAFSALAILLAVWSVVFIVAYVKKRREPKPFVIVPQDVEIRSKADRVFHTIAREYSNSTLSLEGLADNTNISVYHIRNIIRNEYKLSFKEYLKRVRITEAKRLLVESECDIKEVAYRTGFAHPSSFTRTFKELEQLSPSQFRSQNS